MLQPRTPRLGAGLPLGSPQTGKGRGPGCFAPDSWCSAGGSREPQTRSPFIHPKKPMFVTACPAAELLPLLVSTSPTGQAPHATLLPRRLSQTVISLRPLSQAWDHILPATSSPMLGARVCLAGLCPIPIWALERGSRASLGPPSPSQRHQSDSAVPRLWPRSVWSPPMTQEASQHGTSLPNTISVLVSRAGVQSLPQDLYRAVAAGACTVRYQPKSGTPILPSRLLQAGGSLGAAIRRSSQPRRRGC